MELPVPVEKIRHLIAYSFSDTKSYEDLTETEKEVVSEEDYKSLVAWIKESAPVEPAVTESKPRERRYIKPPRYNRAKVDEILGVIRTLAEFAEDHPGVVNVKINLSSDDLLILNDMLYEMDRHLPDFFEK